MSNVNSWSYAIMKTTLINHVQHNIPDIICHLNDKCVVAHAGSFPSSDDEFIGHMMNYGKHGTKTLLEWAVDTIFSLTRE